MKYLFSIYSILMLILFDSCSCKECFNISESVRIIYTNFNGDALLEDSTLIPESVEFCDNKKGLDFIVKDYVVKNSHESYHLEIDNEYLQANCENHDCCILIHFENETTDTLIYSISKVTEDCCTSFPVSNFTYNRIDYLGKTENTIGAYVILK